MYNKILLPLDGTRKAEKSVKHALSVASENADIYFLFVTDSKSLTSVPQEAFDHEKIEDFEKHGEIVNGHAEKLLKEINEKQETRKNITAHSVVVEGNPAKAIIKVSEKLDVDAIVMTSSGKHVIDKFLIGSVVEKVIPCAKVPIIVIPSQAE